jgi:hypothetical protein
MKRYLAFYGHDYYPGGGMNDFVGHYDTKEEAIEDIDRTHKDYRNNSWDHRWCHVYDTVDMEYVFERPNTE